MMSKWPKFLRKPNLLPRLWSGSHRLQPSSSMAYSSRSFKRNKRWKARWSRIFGELFGFNQWLSSQSIGPLIITLMTPYLHVLPLPVRVWLFLPVGIHSTIAIVQLYIQVICLQKRAATESSAGKRLRNGLFGFFPCLLRKLPSYHLPSHFLFDSVCSRLCRSCWINIPHAKSSCLIPSFSNLTSSVHRKTRSKK